MNAASAAVLLVATLSLVATSAMLLVLITRRGGAVWRILTFAGIMAWLGAVSWVGLASTAPERYVRLDGFMPALIVSQTLHSFAMLALAVRVINGNRPGVDVEPEQGG